MKYLLLIFCVMITACSKKTVHFEAPAITRFTPVFSVADSALQLEVTVRVPKVQTDQLTGTVTVTNPNEKAVKWSWKSVILHINEKEVYSDLSFSDVVSYSNFFEIPAQRSRTFRLRWDLDKRQKIKSVTFVEQKGITH